MENVRLLLIASLLFLGLLIYQAWQKDYGSAKTSTETTLTPGGQSENGLPIEGGQEEHLDVPRVASFEAGASLTEFHGNNVELPARETENQ